MLDLLALFAASLFCLQKKDGIALLFRYPSENLRFKGKIHAWCCRTLRKKTKNLLFLTDSPLIAQGFLNQRKLALHVLPIPHAEIATNDDKKDLIECWWPGEPRISKGLEIIQHIVRLNDPMKNKFRCIVSEEANINPSTFVSKIPAVLPRKDYLQQLAKCDLVLLPYSSTMYRASTSGIFVESIIARKVPLVTDDTWMAFELRQYRLNELIVDWTNPAFFTTAHQLLISSEVRKKLDTMQKAYSAYHSIESWAQEFKRHFNDLQSD